MPPTSSIRCDAYLEIACFNVESVLIAVNAGADRIEFCADRTSGGITPSLPALNDVKSKCTEPIHVMIRPRGGDFVYTDVEFTRMKNDIRNIMSLGGIAGGFVFGILDSKNQVDLKRNAELVALANPLPCTFHRAFDEIQDMGKALEDIIACGFDTILTSGGPQDAVAGVEALERLVHKARDRIKIMPGGSVRSPNIKFLVDKTKAEWYHSAAILHGDDLPSWDEIRLLKAAIVVEEKLL
jgi:copper homeostasis protein